jgi:hypothetical protein
MHHVDDGLVVAVSEVLVLGFKIRDASGIVGRVGWLGGADVSHTG